MLKKNKYELNAIKLLRNSKIGILSTHSKQYKGFPFGSFVTFCSGKNREIFFYFSDLAEHTKNLNLNSKSSLTIFKTKKNSNDLQDSKRLTLIGEIKKISKENDKEISDHFFNIIKESKKYSQFHDFNFYRFTIKEGRWIGGFGQIGWLDSKMWLNIDIGWKKAEKAIIYHMNEDHSDSIIASLNAQHKIYDDKAKMVALTIDGYYVDSNNRLYFIYFDKPCISRSEYKDTLVKQSKEYKS